MSKIGDIGIKMFGPKVIIAAIENENPAELGKDTAAILDRILDQQFGNVKSEKVQKVIVPFIDTFVRAFNRELLKETER